MDVSLERLDEIRRATRERANPDNEEQTLTKGVNRYLTTKDESVENAKDKIMQNKLTMLREME